MRRPRIRDEVLRWARRHLELEIAPPDLAEHVYAFVRRQPSLATQALTDTVEFPEHTRPYMLWVVLLIERMFLVQYGDVATPISARKTNAIQTRIRSGLQELAGMHTRLLLRRSEAGHDFRQPAVLKLIIEALQPASVQRAGGDLSDPEDWLRAFLLLNTAGEALDEAIDCGLDLRSSRREVYALMSPTELFHELGIYARFPPKELMAQLMGLPRPLTGMMLEWVDALARGPWSSDLPGYGWGPVHAIRLLSTWRVEQAIPPMLATLHAATAPSAPTPEQDTRDLSVEIGDALLRYGDLALDLVLEALGEPDCTKPLTARDRAFVSVAAGLGVLDPRVKRLLEACEAGDVTWWAERVASYGDPAFLPALRAHLPGPRRQLGSVMSTADADVIRGTIDILETQEGPPVPFQSDIMAFYNRRVPPGRDVDPATDPHLQRLMAAVSIPQHPSSAPAKPARAVLQLVRDEER